MQPRYQVSRAAIQLIKRFEGYRQTAARTPDGRWTIGYGHTQTAREGATVSEKDAEALLLYDLIGVAHAVNAHVFAPLSQNQFDALCAFAFNVGLDAFRSSAVLNRVNEGAQIQASFAMELWRRADFDGESIVVDALVRRRAAEKLLFLTPADGAWALSPTPFLTPRLDHVADFAPEATPDAVATPQADAPASAASPVEQPAPAEVAIPLPHEETDDENVVQAAAEQVSARLQTLFADARNEPPAPYAPAYVREAAPQPELYEPEPEPEPAPVPRWTPPEVDSFVPARDLFEPEVVEAEDAVQPIIPIRVRTQPRIGLPGITALALPGFVFFGGGAFWGAGANPGGVAGPISPIMVAALACLTGVLLFGIAAYLLMQKLGRDAEAESGEAA